VKLLLDTHTFLWWLTDPTRLTPATSSAISDLQNDVLISVCVLWEIGIKRSIGKLTATFDLEHVVHDSGFELLPIDVKHVAAIGTIAVASS
jgi:PIN domain nuclease of toxin-antitoxin system